MLDMHFIDAVQIGDFVEAKCKVVRRTHSLIFMSAELVVGARVVATANGAPHRHDRPLRHVRSCPDGGKKAGRT